MSPSDVPRVAEVHVQAWREAYRGLMPEPFLRELSVDSHVQTWTEVLASPAPGSRHVVGMRPDGLVVAIGSAGPSRDDLADPALELYMLNVLAAHDGTGLADAMMEALVGDEPASLWVLDANDRAIAFYRRQGFVADGTTKAHEPTGTAEVRMRRG